MARRAADRVKRRFSGTLKVSQTARQTTLVSTPSASARSTVRPPRLLNTKSFATLCAYASPNCVFIRRQNSVSRTPPRVLPPGIRPVRRTI